MTNKEAINIINNRINTYYCTDEDLQALDLAIKALKERQQGEWIEHNINVPNCTYYQCSVCGGKFTTGKKFCGDCGAEMKGGTE